MAASPRTSKNNDLQNVKLVKLFSFNSTMYGIKSFILVAVELHGSGDEKDSNEMYLLYTEARGKLQLRLVQLVQVG